MEATYDNYSTGESPSWDVDEIYSDPILWGDSGAFLPDHSTPNFLHTTAPLTPEMQLNDLDLDKLPWGPWGLIDGNQHMNLASESTSMMATSLASSRGDSIWSLSPVESAFTSPLVSIGTPFRTPDLFTLPSPQSYADAFSEFPTSASEPSTDNMDNITIYNPEVTVLANVQEPTAQTAATPLALTMEDRPPGVSSYVPPSPHNHSQTLKLTCTRRREWRNTIKPANCPGCPKMFPFKSGDRKKHIAARHPELAPEHGVSTKKLPCKWCPETFSRKDNLQRHLRNTHAG